MCRKVMVWATLARYALECHVVSDPTKEQRREYYNGKALCSAHREHKVIYRATATSQLNTEINARDLHLSRKSFSNTVYLGWLC